MPTKMACHPPDDAVFLGSTQVVAGATEILNKIISKHGIVGEDEKHQDVP